MSERIFRLVLGALLWAALIAAALYETMLPIYALVALLLFEGITNWRIPIIIARIRYGKDYKQHLDTPACGRTFLGKIEAERMLRFIVVLFVLVSFFVVPDLIWFLPWFVAGMLLLAGITNICPMVMFLRWAGLR